MSICPTAPADGPAPGRGPVCQPALQLGRTSTSAGLEVYCLAPAGVNSSNEGGGKAPHLPEAGNAHDDQNALLAYEMQKAITAGMPLEDRGMKRSRFEVLREAGMPAILIEGGFMSNPADARNIYDTAFRKRMAQAIVDGILAYKKTVERP